MYEEYMQNLLGMQIDANRNTSEGFVNSKKASMYMNDGYIPNNYSSFVNSEDLEDMYPEIYKIVYPMVKKICMQNTSPITRDLIEKMTQEIYSNIETDNVVNLNINFENNSVENRKNENDDSNIENRQIENIQMKDRQKNREMNDLIKILILRELLRKTKKLYVRK